MVDFHEELTAAISEAKPTKPRRATRPWCYQCAWFTRDFPNQNDSEVFYYGCAKRQRQARSEKYAVKVPVVGVGCKTYQRIGAEAEHE